MLNQVRLAVACATFILAAPAGICAVAAVWPAAVNSCATKVSSGSYVKLGDKLTQLQRNLHGLMRHTSGADFQHASEMFEAADSINTVHGALTDLASAVHLSAPLSPKNAALMERLWVTRIRFSNTRVKVAVDSVNLALASVAGPALAAEGRELRDSLTAVLSELDHCKF